MPVRQARCRARLAVAGPGRQVEGAVEHSAAFTKIRFSRCIAFIRLLRRGKHMTGQGLMTTDALEILEALNRPEGKADPYPLYADLHELGEASRFAPGNVIVVGYEAINSLLRDPGFRHPDFAAFAEALPQWNEHVALRQSGDWILNLGAPEHTRIRTLISRAFTARRIAGLRPAIEQMTDDLLDAMADRGADGSPVEFMHDFAYLLPVTVICELIGIPESDREYFRPIARAIATVFEFDSFEGVAEADEATVELEAYYGALAARRRAEPRNDLLSALVGIADGQDGRLSDTELIRNLTLLLVAGFETTTNLLGNGLHLILHDSGLGDGLRGGEIAVGSFVEEVLRYDSPVQLATSRIAYETDLGGLHLEAGDELMPILGAGNRDPRKFTAADKFDPHRNEGSPLSFGGGAHFCIGAALARLEASVAFPRLLTRFADLAPAGEPLRREGLVLRGFDTMPVLVG
jgi:cytochrome P450